MSQYVGVEPKEYPAIHSAVEILVKKPDVTFVGGATPSHYCTVCGAMWKKYEDSWNLRSKECGPCCDNAPMGEQIVPMTAAKALGEALRPLFKDWLPTPMAARIGR